MKLAEKVLSDPEIAFEACSGLLNQKRDESRSSHQPNERRIHEVFAEKAGRHPDREAVTFGENSLTYRELDERSTALAVYLQERASHRNARSAFVRSVLLRWSSASSPF